MINLMKINYLKLYIKKIRLNIENELNLMIKNKKGFFDILFLIKEIHLNYIIKKIL